MALRKDALAFFQADIARDIRHGSLMLFGRPKLLWDNAPTPEDFYAGLGFDQVHSLDVSPYEGATFIHDLNNPDPPAALVGRYDVVDASGTLEHVFMWQNAIQVAFRLLKVGGTLIFGSPMNNWVDHGFYQFSPTVKFDFFALNGWEFRESLLDLYWKATGLRRVSPLYPGEASTLNLGQARASHTLYLVKQPHSTCDRIPKQGLYADIHDGATTRFRFRPIAPAESRDGVLTPTPLKRSVLTDLKPFEGAYRAMFRIPECPPSAPRRPFRSKALVYENGRLLPWVVSHPAMVGERPGGFAHFGRHIHLSASDGGDPLQNGRRYEVAYP